MIKFCNNCYENHINDGMCNYGYFWCIKPGIQHCPICGNNLTNIDFPFEDLKILTSTTNNVRLYQLMIQLYNDNIIEYELKMSQFRTRYEQQQAAKQIQDEEKNTTKCPRCGGTTFTPMKKKWSIWTGFATNQVELVCNNCGYKIKVK